MLLHQIYNKIWAKHNILWRYAFLIEGSRDKVMKKENGRATTEPIVGGGEGAAPLLVRVKRGKPLQ